MEKQDSKSARDDSNSLDREVQILRVVEGERGDDGVFGNTEGGIQYNTVGWVSASILMMKTQIGLGVLSIPYVLSVFGAVPGVLIILGTSIVTTWSDLEVGRFKLRHKECYSLSDVGFIVGGKVGREVYGFIYFAFMVCVVGSSFIGISTCLNAISVHGACTAVFIAVMAVAAFVLSSIQTLHRISWLSYIGLTSIFAAILTLAIAVLVQDRPAAAPETGPWDKGLLVTAEPTFSDAMLALSTVVFSFAGTPAFLPIASEMRDTRSYYKATILCQTVVTWLFLAIGIIVYYSCGVFVASPALGSAGPLLKRVCYGLALPGLMVTMTIYTHLPGKWLLVRLLRGTPHLTTNTVRHWATWVGCLAFCVIISYVFASAIPSFNDIVGLVGALFGTFLCMQAMGIMWLHDEKEDVKKGKKRNWLGTAWAAFVILIGTFILIGGTYGSVMSIKAAYASSSSSAWSCADNSNSV